MPSRWLRLVIIAFWLVMTYQLVRRDVLPTLGYGDIDYRTLVEERMLDERSNWILRRDGERLGRVMAEVTRTADGGHDFATRATLDLGFLLGGPQSEPDAGVAPATPEMHLHSVSHVYVGPLGRLTRFVADLSLDDGTTVLSIEGQVEGDYLVIQPKLADGDEMDAIRLPIDPSRVMTDSFGTVDRLPGLHVGKEWTTRIMNPLASVPSPLSLFGRQPEFHIVRHEVVGTEEIVWDERPVSCFVVVTEHQSTEGRSWVRQSDGRVLRAETPLQGWMIELELEPTAANRETDGDQP